MRFKRVKVPGFDNMTCKVYIIHSQLNYGNMYGEALIELSKKDQLRNKGKQLKLWITQTKTIFSKKKVKKIWNIHKMNYFKF